MKLHKNYVPELDGLKGMAVALIVAYTCYMTLLSFELLMPAEEGLNYWVQALLTSGWVGLDVFMVVAGFLTTCELLAGISLSSYYSRRWRRILPAYFLFLVLWLVLALFLKPEVVHLDDVASWVSVLTLSSNVLVAKEGLWRLPPHFAHLWSVALLAQFYILWPAVIRFLGGSGRSIGLCIALIVGLPVVRGLLIQSDGELSTTALVIPFLRLDSFAWGAALALVGERMIQSIWVLVGGFVSLILMGGYWVYAGGMILQDPVVLTVGLTWVAIWSLSLLCSILPETGDKESRSNPVAAVLAIPLLQTLGKYSFTLYLVHQPLILIFVFWAYLPGPGWSPFVVFYALSLAVSLFVAVLSFHFWERRFIAD